ncbi:MAG TPA: helix-turn-helix transcriptional regulator [Candidatus Binatia bacterium]|nr:helix-turn-helix transcriptional regulator [Candidatus Binatia bacterium]
MNDERAANAIDRKLGQRVRTRRLEIGMSQERLAELLGVTFQQVQKYEKGINRIAASRLFDISAALDMPIGRFFEGLPGRGAAGVAEAAKDYIGEALATPEGAQLMALFASIKSVKVRRRVIELVRALTEEAADGKR